MMCSTLCAHTHFSRGILVLEILSDFTTQCQVCSGIDYWNSTYHLPPPP